MAQAVLVEGSDAEEERDEVGEPGKVAKSGHTNEVDTDLLAARDNIKKFSHAQSLTYTI